MTSIINTNINSLTAQRNLGMNQASLANSMQRLSSGLRINSAKDDAAGLAISERFTSQIRGLNQAARNANDAISLSQTAEGALGSISGNLQRMRELAVQSANGTNNDGDRQALQAEVSQLQAEIGRVASTTQFNGKNLIDGTLTNTDFQVGANSGQIISISVSSAKATDIGNNVINTTGITGISDAKVGAVNAVTTDAGPQKISGNGVLSAAFVITAADSGKVIAAAINAVSAPTGVTATAVTTATLSGVTAGAVSFTLTGGSGTKVISATVTKSSDLSALATAVNKTTASTGVTATSDTLGNLILSSDDGSDVNVLSGNTVGLGADTATLKGSGAAVGQAIAIAGAAAGVTVGAKLTLDSSSAFSVTGSAQTTVFGSAAAASATNSVALVDIGTSTGATDAIKTIDAAIGQINSQRAALGAVQNRFDSTVNNLQTSSENMSASRSRIQDADFAQETANLSRSQILQQAGTAMVAQANQLPQGVLALLR